MEIQEIKDKNEHVVKLKISAATEKEAHDAACDWCEENNCILNNVSKSEDGFIANVCGDDYN